MQDRIVLIGFMFCGKTTLGRKLAKRLDYQFFDIDKEIEKKTHYTVNDIFTKFSEQNFRDIERQVLQSLLEKNTIVVACGGGTPCFFDNMRLIKQKSTSIYLYLTPEKIFSRLKVSKKTRPLMKNIPPNEQLQYITETLKTREHFYMQADITINAFNPNIEKTIELLSLKK